MIAPNVLRVDKRSDKIVIEKRCIKIQRCLFGGPLSVSHPTSLLPTELKLQYWIFSSISVRVNLDHTGSHTQRILLKSNTNVPLAAVGWNGVKVALLRVEYRCLNLVQNVHRLILEVQIALDLRVGVDKVGRQCRIVWKIIHRQTFD